MKTLSAVFLCGDQSPYGLAHLDAIIKNFDLKAIIIADDSRWCTFRKNLSGGAIYESNTFKKKIRKIINKVIDNLVIALTKNQLKSSLHINKIPIIRLNDVNSKKSLKIICTFSPDIILSAAYPQIFSEELINSIPKGAVNFHPSLLPRCRGAHPHYWCLATGEKKGGITAHFMTKNIDDGDIIAQHEFDIETMYYDDLYKKIIKSTPKLVEDVALFFSDSNSTPIPQDEKAITVFRNDREIHRKLDFCNMTSIELFNKIRAGRAYLFYQNIQFFIIKADVIKHNRHMTNDLSVSPGTIVDISDDGVFIYTIDNSFIVLKNIKWAKKAEPFTNWLDAFNIKIGVRFV